MRCSAHYIVALVKPPDPRSIQMVPYFELRGHAAAGVNNANDISLSRFLHFIAGCLKNDGMIWGASGSLWYEVVENAKARQ